MGGSDQLALNPRLEFQLEGADLRRVSVLAPMRGGPARLSVLTDPALVAPVLLRREAGLIDTLDAEQLETLRAAGILVRSDDVAGEVRFRVDPPTKPVPSDGRRASSAWIQRDAVLPKSLTERVRSVPSTLATGPVLWTEDPARKILTPSWFKPGLLDAVESFAEGGAPAAALKPLLSAVGAWASPRTTAQRVHRWGQHLAKAKRDLSSLGYAVVSGLLPPHIVQALATYLRALAREGYLALGDSQSLRFWRHNEPVVMIFHRELSAVVSRVAGTAMKPSYCYLAAYEPGADLKRHVDREQCELSISLQIDYEPRPRRALSPWPLWLLPKSRTAVPIHLRAGDGLIYRGREIPHFRDPLPAGHRSISVFLHYVRGDFAGPLSYWSFRRPHPVA